MLVVHIYCSEPFFCSSEFSFQIDNKLVNDLEELDTESLTIDSFVLSEPLTVPSSYKAFHPVEWKLHAHSTVTPYSTSSRCW